MGIRNVFLSSCTRCDPNYHPTSSDHFPVSLGLPMITARWRLDVDVYIGTIADHVLSLKRVCSHSCRGLHSLLLSAVFPVREIDWNVAPSCGLAVEDFGSQEERDTLLWCASPHSIPVHSKSSVISALRGLRSGWTYFRCWRPFCMSRRCRLGLFKDMKWRRRTLRCPHVLSR
jgi:hypothetical protein